MSDLHAQLRQFENLKMSLQTANSINAGSQPRRRTRNILDLPNEILVNILGYVSVSPLDWDPILDSPHRIKEVQNMRLTCRRFYHAISDRLIKAVSVEMRPGSLSRLDEISRHRLISKGVRSVRVSLRCYDSVLANDLRKFANFNVAKLREKARRLERSRASWPRFKIREEVGQLTLDTVQTIVASWNEMTAVEHDPQEGWDERTRYQTVLRIAHQEYRHRFREQEQIRRDGRFAHMVAEAMARFPSATTLQLHDKGVLPTSISAFPALVADDESLALSTLDAIQWEEARLHGLGSAPLELLVRIPTAIQQVRNHLTDLRIEVTPPVDLSLLALEDTDRQRLGVLVRRLTDITFRITGRDMSIWLTRESEEVDRICNFLEVLLDSESLERISLHIDSVWDAQLPLDASLGSVTTQPRWPKLASLSLITAPFDIIDFEHTT